MIRLIINNSYSKLEGFTSEEFNALRKLLSYKIDAQSSYFSKSWKNTGYLINKRGEFPSGLLYRLEAYLKKNKINYIKKDIRVRPKASPDTFNMKLSITPYKGQEEALKSFLSSDGRGTLQAATGYGKSLIIGLLINKLNLKTLVVVPNLGLKKQLSDSIREWFGDLNNITVENIDSEKLQKKESYDFLIIDEAHHGAAKTYRDLNKKYWTNIYYRCCLTATPFRTNTEEQILMESLTSKVLHSISYKQAVEEKVIVPVEAYYINLPKIKTEAHTWKQVYSELVVNRKDRNEIIRDLIVKLHTARIPTICLVKEILHGNLISEPIGAAFANGQNEECEQLKEWFNERRLSALVGTIGILGEGVDTKPAEYIIIAGLGKSKTQFMQNVGRGVRRYLGKESCKVILFRDPSHKFTLRHFNAQAKYLREEYGVKVKKID